jgi:hypothetical protein
MAHQNSVPPAESISPTCAVAVGIALADLRSLHSANQPGDSITFENVVRQKYHVIVCTMVDRHRISVALNEPVHRGGGEWYMIDAKTLRIVERVSGR